MSDSDSDRPRAPRAEPEIIPPGTQPVPGEPEAWAQTQRAWTTQRVFVARPGPLAQWLVLLGLVGVIGIVVMLVAGLFLLAMPVAAIIVAAYALSRFLRPRATVPTRPWELRGR